MAGMIKTTTMNGMQPDQGSDMTQGGGMLKRMVAKNGPVAGKKEFFSTLQKQHKIGKNKVIGSKRGF